MIYDRIKELCQECNTTVSAVEREAKLSNGTIRKWNKSSPSVDNLQAVARVLKVRVEKLIS